MAKSTQTAAPKAQTPAAVKAAATRAAKKAEQATKVLEKPAEQHDVTDEQRAAEAAQAQANAVAQFAQSQMATPAAHTPELDQEAAKLAAFQEAVKALATASGIDPSTILAPVQPAAQGKGKSARADRLVQNGITRPASGTTTGKIWDLADKMSADAGGQPVAIGTLRAHVELKQTNDHTIKTQYARWRQFHGIKGRVAAPVAQPASPEGDDEGIAQAWGRRAEDQDRRAPAQ
jgi:hypothetical protein